MTLEKAIEEVEKRKMIWTKNRGQEVKNFIWYIIPFNDSYAITDTTKIKRHPNILKDVVYDTEIGYYKA